MVNTMDSDFDEDAVIEALKDRLAAQGNIIKREHQRELKGYPRDVALEKWGPTLEERLMRDMEQMRKAQKPRGQVVPMVNPRKNPPK